MVSKKEQPAKKPRELGLEDMMKMLYALLNTVGGNEQMVTMPCSSLDKMPIDWMDRIAMREIPELDAIQIYLKQRKGEKKKSTLKLPPVKKLILPHNCG